jgi:hypothetical protein
MDKLCDLAKVLRSKNSGPYAVTLDVLFDSPAVYQRVKESGVLTQNKVAELYQMPASRITHFVWFDAGLGVKITYLREVASGTVGDRDVYGAQQHAPLMGLLIP